MDFSKTHAKQKWFKYSDFDKSQPESKAQILVKNRNYDIDFLVKHGELKERLKNKEITSEQIEEEFDKLILDRSLINHKHVKVRDKTISFSKNNAKELFKSTYYLAFVKWAVLFADFSDEASFKFEKSIKN